MLLMLQMCTVLDSVHCTTF